MLKQLKQLKHSSTTTAEDRKEHQRKVKGYAEVWLLRRLLLLFAPLFKTSPSSSTSPTSPPDCQFVATFSVTSVEAEQKRPPHSPHTLQMIPIGRASAAEALPLPLPLPLPVFCSLEFARASSLALGTHHKSEWGRSCSLASFYSTLLYYSFFYGHVKCGGHLCGGGGEVLGSNEEGRKLCQRAPGFSAKGANRRLNGKHLFLFLAAGRGR